MHAVLGLGSARIGRGGPWAQVMAMGMHVMGLRAQVMALGAQPWARIPPWARMGSHAPWACTHSRRARAALGAHAWRAWAHMHGALTVHASCMLYV